MQEISPLVELRRLTILFVLADLLEDTFGKDDKNCLINQQQQQRNIMDGNINSFRLNRDGKMLFLCCSINNRFNFIYLRPNRSSSLEKPFSDEAQDNL